GVTLRLAVLLAGWAPGVGVRRSLAAALRCAAGRGLALGRLAADAAGNRGLAAGARLARCRLATIVDIDVQAGEAVTVAEERLVAIVLVPVDRHLEGDHRHHFDRR